MTLRGVRVGMEKFAVKTPRTYVIERAGGAGGGDGTRARPPAMEKCLALAFSVCFSKEPASPIAALADRSWPPRQAATPGHHARPPLHRPGPADLPAADRPPVAFCMHDLDLADDEPRAQTHISFCHLPMQWPSYDGDSQGALLVSAGAPHRAAEIATAGQGLGLGPLHRPRVGPAQRVLEANLINLLPELT